MIERHHALVSYDYAVVRVRVRGGKEWPVAWVNVMTGE